MNWLQRIFSPNRVNFQPTYPIPSTEGKRWAIGDIHGCYKTFLALLDQLQLHKKDQLFLLGDVINKGPASGLVIDEILRLQQLGYQIFVLRGNHEQMILDIATKESYKLTYALERFKSTDLLHRKNKIRAKHLHFIQSLPYYFELERHFLVHAGFNFKSPQPFQDFDSMMWTRSFQAQSAILKGKHLVHGHVPTPLPVITYATSTQQLVIPLDNGCVYWNQRENQGNLIALELNSWELKIQQNEDFKMVFGTRIAIIDE